FSQGLNLGLHFLSGALTYDAAANDCEALLASKIVWLDAFIINVDRTFKNTNLLIWKKELWLIDHGASFYFHHSWINWETTAKTPFTLIKDHVLLPKASKLEEAHQLFTSKLNAQILKEIVNQIPEDWLQWEDQSITSDEIKEIYFQFLSIRLQNAELFLNQAQDARKTLI
ncbi:MAG TPA: HipA family kinase, partial [Flavobacterium sp.]|nr:HipA family kinase [Flavobacterium sp.]